MESQPQNPEFINNPETFIHVFEPLNFTVLYLQVFNPS